MPKPKPVAKKRFYLIGMDSTPVWILEQFSREQGMGSFAKMLDAKQISDLESTIPPMTGAAWPSIYTGLTPGEHGVPDFFIMTRDYTPDIVFYDSEAVPPIWKTLADNGYRCLVITPATEIKAPSHKNIDLMTGFPLKSKTNSKDIEQRMQKYDFWGEPDIEKAIKDGKMTPEDASKAYVKSIAARSQIAREMIESKEYDFIFVCFTETDRLQHFVLNKPEMKSYLLPLYREINKFLEYVLKRVDEEGSAAMLVSDHGAQPIYNKFLINSWLIDNGYAVLKKSIEEITSDAEDEEGKPSTAYSLREKLLKSRLRKVYDKLPFTVKKAVFSLLGSFFSKGGSGAYTRLHLFDFDMTKTRAFPAISNFPVTTLWINDKRFKNGIVSDSEKKVLKTEIITKLKTVKSAEGDTMFPEVTDAEPYYKGTEKFIPPDLFASAKKGYTIDVFNYSKATPFMAPEAPKSGDHTMMGIFGFYSRSVKVTYSNVSVLNITPTILDYYGLESKTGKRSVMVKE